MAEEFSVAERPTNHRVGRPRDTALYDALLSTLEGGAVRLPLKKRKPHVVKMRMYQRGWRLGYKVRSVLDGDTLLVWLVGKREKKQ